MQQQVNAQAAEVKLFNACVECEATEQVAASLYKLSLILLPLGSIQTLQMSN